MSEDNFDEIVDSPVDLNLPANPTEHNQKLFESKIMAANENLGKFSLSSVLLKAMEFFKGFLLKKKGGRENLILNDVEDYPLAGQMLQNSPEINNMLGQALQRKMNGFSE